MAALNSHEIPNLSFHFYYFRIIPTSSRLVSGNSFIVPPSMFAEMLLSIFLKFFSQLQEIFHEG